MYYFPYKNCKPTFASLCISVSFSESWGACVCAIILSLLISTKYMVHCCIIFPLKSYTWMTCFYCSCCHFLLSTKSPFSLKVGIIWSHLQTSFKSRIIHWSSKVCQLNHFLLGWQAHHIISYVSIPCGASQGQLLLNKNVLQP